MKNLLLISCLFAMLQTGCTSNDIPSGIQFGVSYKGASINVQTPDAPLPTPSPK